jgi:hypothetical protein
MSHTIDVEGSTLARAGQNGGVTIDSTNCDDSLNDTDLTWPGWPLPTILLLALRLLVV